MTTTPPSTRRDTRHRLRDGSSCVEFDDPHADGASVRGAVVAVSAAGLCFRVDADATSYPAGTCLTALTVRVGECLLRGEAVVRNVRGLGPNRVELGCLFYPAAAEEDRWMTLLAGIEVAASSGEDLL
jgi:hypothetical protein